MKIRIEVDENIQEDEVIIKCANLNEEIQNLQGAIKDALSKKNRIIFYKDNTQFYISLDEILFFETEETSISAHTLNNVYEVKYKLYELYCAFQTTVKPSVYISRHMASEIGQRR